MDDRRLSLVPIDELDGREQVFGDDWILLLEASLIELFPSLRMTILCGLSHGLVPAEAAF